jgi:hypothetical protein
MADYDENGWTDDSWIDPSDVAFDGAGRRKAE